MVANAKTHIYKHLCESRARTLLVHFVLSPTNGGLKASRRKLAPSLLVPNPQFVGIKEEKSLTHSTVRPPC